MILFVEGEPEDEPEEESEVEETHETIEEQIQETVCPKCSGKAVRKTVYKVIIGFLCYDEEMLGDQYGMNSTIKKRIRSTTCTHWRSYLLILERITLSLF